MRKLAMVTALALSSMAVPASAVLPVGHSAPDFRTMGALNGKPFRLHLAEQLKNGPVVLYFYPKAFTKAARSKRAPSPKPILPSSPQGRG